VLWLEVLNFQPPNLPFAAESGTSFDPTCHWKLEPLV